MTYGELLGFIVEECDNTDCQHCILYELCVKYDTTPEKVKQYLLECEKEL